MFGYEESVGYAASPKIRDKDGISAGMLVAEAAAFYKKQGKTLFQVLSELGEKYGYYSEAEPNLILKGVSGAERIRRMMDSVRGNLPVGKVLPAPAKTWTPNGKWDTIAGIPVTKVVDYRNGYEDIPASNVLRFFLENGSWFAVRPSGTEPKIKFYFYSKQDSREKADEINTKIRDAVLGVIEEVE